MHVVKFGGSSVANADKIKKVIEIIRLKATTYPQQVVVVSALGGITDILLQYASEALLNNGSHHSTWVTIQQRHINAMSNLLPLVAQAKASTAINTLLAELQNVGNGIALLGELSPRIQDKVASYGELLSSTIIAQALQVSIASTLWADARQLIITNDNYKNAVVNFEATNQKITQYFANNTASIYLVPGFIAATATGVTTTLGRGGSDYTAAILAGTLQATELEIWTDVSGMMTADPRIVPTAKIIPAISYQEAMELSHFGAKVIYPPTIQPVMHLGIPVYIKNTFEPSQPGTIIKNCTVANTEAVRGISSINSISLISLEGSGMIGIPGFSKRLFATLATQQINVILITQSSSEHSICVGISTANAAAAKTAIDDAFDFEIKTDTVQPLIIENDLAIVAVVGDNMKSQTGTAGRMFSTLGRNGINIRAIAQGSSEKNISAVVAAKEVTKCVNVLHETFFETEYKQVHLFIAGCGNVGKLLLAQLLQQFQFFKEEKHIQFNVVGIANSTKAMYNEAGIDLATWATEMPNAAASNIEQFVQTALDKNLRNTIFVDVTANAQVAAQYPHLLQRSMAVVACNKIASSSTYSHYKHLKQTANNQNTKYLFETNVGAALPIIGTLNDITNSGDSIVTIEGVLSGTLNYVFNYYDTTTSFASVVRQAQNEGFTEPDPRLDLSGTDVQRKLLILCREAGLPYEMSDIENKSFMPPSCMVGSVQDFYVEMEKNEAHFAQLYNAAKAEGCKLKFVASYTNGKAVVGLQQIAPQHDFYNLYGKDNIVLFYTNRYATQPMVVKGAGAGAAVTASGVFADIVRATQH